jgi:hypothetical protein
MKPKHGFCCGGTVAPDRVELVVPPKAIRSFCLIDDIRKLIMPFAENQTLNSGLVDPGPNPVTGIA